jgi:hypothetical protein
MPFTITNSKSINDVKVRAKIIELSEENIGEKLHSTGFDNFLMMIPKSQATKEKKNR